MIVGTGGSKSTQSFLVPETGGFSVFIRSAELILIMGVGACESFSTLNTIGTHGCAIVFYFALGVFTDRFSLAVGLGIWGVCRVEYEVGEVCGLEKGWLLGSGMSFG